MDKIKENTKDKKPDKVEDKITVLVPNDALDSIVRATMAAINAREDSPCRVIIAGPGEGARGGVEAPAISSKISPKAIRAYRRIMREHGVKVTFTPSTSGLSNMLFASLFMGVSNLAYRGTQHRVHKSDPFNWLAILNPRVKHVLCETKDIEEHLATLIRPSKLSCLPKPFELEWVEDALKNPIPVPSQEGSKLRLITIGMFKGRPFKGLKPLLQAMKMVGDLPVTLTVVGSADDEDIASALKSVTFVGPQKGATHYIPGHDLYMLTSTRDASPRTVREALACGVPCVVSDIPGARDLISPGECGVYCRPGDAESIAACIRDFYDHPDKLQAMSGQVSREHIANFSDMASYVQHHIDLFTEYGRKKQHKNI